MTEDAQRFQEVIKKLHPSHTDNDVFLLVLALVYRDHPNDFDRIDACNTGTKRVYFSTSKEQIEKSGRNTHPQQIPASPYYAFTNENTQRKRSIIDQVLTLFGYSHDARAVVREAFDKIVAARRLVEGLL
ncbi:MAG: hypothetical protein IAE97_06765 [Chthoniobacterales bacterium]|nr:hypothetical protein [Chthoniobacterales bacterium]